MSGVEWRWIRMRVVVVEDEHFDIFVTKGHSL